MFEQNMKELEKKNPALAAKIKAHPYESIKNIEVYEAESKNLIISYKGILLHSNEDPLRETKSIWHKTVKNELKANDIQLVYGLGLGYLFKRAYVSANSRVLLFEPNIEILRFVFENVDFSAELSDERVFVVNNQEDAAKFFESKYLAGDKIEVLFLPAYLELDQKGLLDLSNRLFQAIKDKNIDQNTSLLMSKWGAHNLIQRLRYISKHSPVNILADTCKNKTALVLAAGPSLKDDLELIKKNREKFVVIAILPTLTLLKKHGIRPDFVTVADPKPQTPKIEEIKDDLKDINLVMESRADFHLDVLNFKSIFVYFPSLDKISETILNSIPKNKTALLSPCASVAILSYRLAEILGCKEIIFSGLDLAMTNNQLYADDNTKIVSQTEKELTIKSNDGEFTVVPTTTKGADGSDVKTREDYLVFIREFEKIVKENPNIKVTNTALKGALIEGMIYETMSKTIKTLEKAEIDIDSIVEKALKTTLKDFQKESMKLIKTTKASFASVKETFVKSVSIADELISELSLEKPDMEKFEKTYNESKPVFSEARTFATQDLILSSYMQAEIAEFVTKYNKDAQLTLALLKENLEIEKIFFERNLDTMDYLTTVIEEIIKDVSK